ncbi:ABC transporter substrate-binding protein [Nocardioides sp. LHD-245]|uniref:ABC transporter substrate-binding protein n=1 Tax=Nocardioides sp. LHD-245 TaxID=3051387 RepID=UPI0027E013A1|nr:ABC transporter substrate-binding protein [Nocardioides sp. LHD-245]
MAVSTITLLAACAANPDDKPRNAGSSLTVNVLGAPTTVDPAMACGAADMHLMESLYARLVEYGTSDGPSSGTSTFDPASMRPGLAESWEVSPDGRTYTFTIREGVSFPSGEPVDAEAVRYSLQRTIDMAQCGFSYLSDGFDEPPLISSVEAEGDDTVVIELSVADVNLPQVLAQPAASIVDPVLIEEHGGVVAGEGNAYFASHSAGATGPFVLAEYEAGVRAVLRRNPDFWGEPTASDEVVVAFVSDPSTMLLQAKSGQADVTVGLAASLAEKLDDDDCCSVVAFDSGQSLDIALNWSVAPFDNQKFREALTYALPYDDLHSTLGRGFGTRFYGPIAPGLPQYDADLERPREQDLDRASKLIDESGLARPISFELTVPADNSELKEFGTAVQAALAEADVQVSIRELAPAQRSDALNERDFAALALVDGPGIVDAGYYLSYDMNCASPYNISAMCIPAADQAWTEARVTTDDDERRRLYDTVIKEWVGASPKLKFWSMPGLMAIGEEVEHVTYGVHLNFSTWR